MNGFEFTLDPVIRLRAHELERSHLELAIALGRQKDALREAGALAGELCASQVALQDHLSEGIAGGPLSLLLQGADQLRSRLERCEQARRRADLDVDRARSRVVESQARLRALERLRQQRLSEYQRELARREEREMDEVAQIVAARAEEGSP